MKNKGSVRYRDAKSKVEKTKLYSLEEAVTLVKETGKAGFDASVEVHANLGIDPRKSDQQIRGTVVLPHGTGRTVRIAAFVGPNNEADAKSAGADVIYGEEEIKKLKDTGKIDFDVAVATPDMMPKLAMAARILGPRGLMPNPKTDTVGPDVAKMIEALKKGKAAFKNDNTSNIHQAVGKVSFSEDKLIENITTFVDVLKKAKPASAKGTFIKGLYLTSTMGPSIKLDPGMIA